MPRPDPIQELKNQLQALQVQHADLRKQFDSQSLQLKNIQSERDTLKAKTDDLNAQVKTRGDEIKALQVSRDTLRKDFDVQTQRIQELQQERDALKDELAKTPKVEAAQHFTLDTISQSVKGILENLQANTLAPSATGTAATLRSIDLNLKGFVQLQDNAVHIVAPQPSERVDPNILSELKMSFVTVPTLPKPKS